MFNSLRLFWRGKQSLRVRLTAWYMLLLACTMLVFSSYLYLQLKYSLLGQLDTTLKVTATEILTNLVIDRDRHLRLKDTEPFQLNQQELAHAGFVVRIIAPQGNIIDGFGNYRAIGFFLPKNKGYQNLNRRSKIWRIYNLPLAIADGKITEALKSNRQTQWLQVAQSLQPVTKALDHLWTLIWLGFPIVLLFAGLGGLFLADRALRPINRIIHTAEAINPDDLSYRINYRGVSDEVGRLAMTLDRMLDRIELAFEHERRFIADASHELRTPLTVIKGRIGVTLNRQRTPAEYQTTLQDLESQTDRLIRLTNGLLFLARLEQKQLQKPENLLKLDLSSLLEVLIEQIQPIAEVRQINLTAKIIADLSILGNCDLLTSLFLNLLDNAIKYTPSGGRIQIETRRNQTQITVAISNTGSGIAAQDLPFLFDRFYRRDRDRDIQGAGLGLAIATLIARCHGGQISVTSQIHELTTFKVSLPSLRMSIAKSGKGKQENS